MAESTWMLTAAAVTAVLGFAWLALAMETHWKQVFGQAEPGRRSHWALRSLGTLALLASLILCLAADRPSIAALVWVMLLAPAAMLVALMLAWQPRWLRTLWPG